MQDPTDDPRAPLNRLIGRYGQARGTYLFGELCLLRLLGWEAFQRRHRPEDLGVLAAELQPLSLWPAFAVADAAGAAAPVANETWELAESDPFDAEDPLEIYALSLRRQPITLKVGSDLLAGLHDWTEAGRFEPARAALTEALGFLVPRDALERDEQLAPTELQLCVYGEAVEALEVFPGLDLLLAPEEGPLPALPYAWQPDPAGVARAIAWMPIGPNAELPAGVTQLHWITGIERFVSARLPRHAHRLLTVPGVKRVLFEAEEAGYDHELERYLSLPELRLVFQALLRQGLPLRPLPAMLEALTAFVLSDLGNRAPSAGELERLQRQLPVYPVARLVGVVRQALGLALEPTPLPFGLALDLPADRFEPAGFGPAERAAYAGLAASAEAERAVAGFWAAALRPASASPRAPMADALDRAFEWPLDGPIAFAMPRARQLASGPMRTTLRAAVAGYLAVLRPLREIDRWLARPAALPGAGAREWLGSPDWPSWRYRLARPRALLREAGLEDEWTRYLAATAQRSGP